MSASEHERGDAAIALLELYDIAVIEVHRYLEIRSGSVQVAEDLTSETFMAAVTEVHKGRPVEVTTAWLIGIARHKLVDHYRRVERESRRLHAVADDRAVGMDPTAGIDAWDTTLDAMVAHDVLAGLSAQHRLVLTLRYLDGLSVREVATHLGRSLGAAEQLLVRARVAFRDAMPSNDAMPVNDTEPFKDADERGDR